MKAGRDDDDQDEGPGCEAGLWGEQMSDTFVGETRRRVLRGCQTPTRSGCEAGLLVGVVASFVAAPGALAGYGRGAVYQVEISANNVGGVPGDGARGSGSS